jgi:hypothetical protein
MKPQAPAAANDTETATRFKELLNQIGPLPLRGDAWPKWIKILAWIVLAIIALRLIITASGPEGHNISPLVAGSILLCFGALVVIAGYMVKSKTTISASGIEQTWISRRFIAWEDIQFAKFVPLIASKRLICFTGKSRPIVFQAGTPELQIAFARIALIYRRKK